MGKVFITFSFVKTLSKNKNELKFNEKVKILLIYRKQNQNISLDFSKIKAKLFIDVQCLLFSIKFSAKIHYIVKIKKLFVFLHFMFLLNEIMIN
jgi:hypothetical protein